MIRVTVELCPGGDTSNTRVLGKMEIANDLTGDVKKGNYRAEVSWPNGTRQQIRRRARIVGFPRSLSAWELIRLVLQKVAHDSGKGIVW